jgi:hypothetical protein
MPTGDQFNSGFGELARRCVAAIRQILQQHPSPREILNHEFGFDRDSFNIMDDAAWIVDGRCGGLLIGRSHADGHIRMVHGPFDGHYRVFTAAEGGEYVVNYRAYENEKTRLDEINSFKDEHCQLSEIAVSPASRILNTHAEPNDKLLWIGNGGVFIVNKRATAKHFSEIEEINQKWNPGVNCDLKLLKRKDSV